MPLLDRWDARGGTLHQPLRLAVRALGRSTVTDAVLAGWNRPPEGEPPIAAAVLEGDRWTAADGAAWVRTQLARPEASARSDAAAVLALIGDQADLSALSRMAAQDPDEQVRWLAAVAARSLAGGDLTP
jgi:hypothetical protein